MYKRILVALMLSLVLRFNSKTIPHYFISVILLSAFFYSIFSLCISINNSVKEKKFHKIIIIYGFVIISSLLLVTVFTGEIGLGITPIDELHQNIITQKCIIGKYTDYDFWYYKRGCDQESKKVDAIKSSDYLNNLKEICELSCEKENNSTKFVNNCKPRTFNHDTWFRDINCSIIN